MVLTIDTSVLLAVLLNEEHKSAIIDHTEGYDLQSPLSLDAEVGNAISAMFKRGRLSLDKAKQVLEQLNNIPIRRTNLRLEESCRLAYNHDLYAYDAYVLDCARQFRTPLLSLDESLKAVGRAMNLTILEV